MFLAPPWVETENLTEFCRIVAEGEGDGLVALCEKLDAKSSALSNPLPARTSGDDVYELAKGLVNFVGSGHNQSRSSLADGLVRLDFRRAIKDFYSHYAAIPYHSVYLRPSAYPTQVRSGAAPDPFLSTFYGFLHDVAAKTLDVYFRPSDLLPLTKHRDAQISRDNEERGNARSIWWNSNLGVGWDAHQTYGKSAESSLLVWDHAFEPTLLPLGRYVPPVKASAIATMVTGLEAGMGVKAACDLASADPVQNFEKASAQFNSPVVARRWLAALRRRHEESPEAGYDEAARIVRQLLLPSPLARAYASTRLRTVAGILVGGIVVADRAEVIIDLPQAWHTLISWF